MSRLGSRFKAEFSGQIVGVAAGGLLTVLLARLLDPDGYGLLFLAISVFSVAGIVSKLGIAKSGARYVAEYEQKDPSQIPHILRTTLLYNLVTIVAVCLVFVAGNQYLAVALDEPGLGPFLAIGAAYLAFEALKTYVRLVFQGFEEIEYAATIHVIDQVTRLVFAVGFVLLGFGAVGALWGYVLSLAVASLVGLGVLYLRFYRTRDAATRVEEGLRRRIAEYTAPLTATSTSNVLDKQMDTVLVGFFLTPVAVSYYVISKQAIEFVEVPVTALGFTLSPTFGAQKADGNVDRAARLYEQALSHSLLVYIPVAAGIVLVAEPTIELVFGAEYLGAVPVLQVLALYTILQAITRLTSNSLDYLGRAKDRAIVKGITAVMNVLLNVILIPTVGVVGAAIATIITYSLYTLGNLWIVHTEFDLRISYLLGHVLQVTLITGVMAGVVAATVGYVAGPISLALVILLGGAIWAGLSVLAGLVDPKRFASIL